MQYLLDRKNGYDEKAAKAHVKFRLFQRFEQWYYTVQLRGNADWRLHCNVQQMKARRVAEKFW